MLACLVLLQAQMPMVDAAALSGLAARTVPVLPAAPDPELRRLSAFVHTLYAEGAVEKLEPCRRWDACVSVTAMFQSFPEWDKKAIARLIRRYFETSSGGSAVLSVRFLDARSGRELGRFHEDRLHWAAG